MTKKLDLHVKATYDPKQKVAIASTDVLDRQGEMINQNGWDLQQYKANPVLLWAHDNYEPAIGIGQNVRVGQISADKKALLFEPVFHGKTELSKAMQILYNGDDTTPPVLNSFSVGFRPLDDMDGSTYPSSELLEISCVNVPANPDARMLAYKSIIKGGVSAKVAKDITGLDSKTIMKFSHKALFAEFAKRFKKLGVDVTVKGLTKGAVQDELDAEQSYEDKSDNMEDAYEVWWAFCDVYFDENTPAEDFTKLLAETITILGTIADGTYVDPDDDTKQIAPKVLDRFSRLEKDVTSLQRLVKGKIPPAPKAKVLSKRQMMAKAITKASDMLLEGDKHKTLSTDQNKTLIKIIKRASEKISSSQKEQING